MQFHGMNPDDARAFAENEMALSVTLSTATPSNGTYSWDDSNHKNLSF